MITTVEDMRCPCGCGKSIGAIHEELVGGTVDKLLDLVRYSAEEHKGIIYPATLISAAVKAVVDFAYGCPDVNLKDPDQRAEFLAEVDVRIQECIAVDGGNDADPAAVLPAVVFNADTLAIIHRDMSRYITLPQVQLAVKKYGVNLVCKNFMGNLFRGLVGQTTVRDLGGK